MLHYPRWKIVLIACVMFFGAINVVPNLVGRDGRVWMSENLPSWLPSKGINLGLDLQGGSHILLDIGFDTVYTDTMNGIADALRQNFRAEGIRVASLSASLDSVVIMMNDAADGDKVRKQIRSIDPALLIETDDRMVTITQSESARRDLVSNTISQTIEIVRRRVDETGTNEPIIQRQGDTRVLVQLPGVDDPERIKNLLGKTAKLGFHLTDERASRTGRGGAGALVLPMLDNSSQMLGVKRRAMITGDMLTNASAQFANGMPVVSFRLDARGADRFCRLSRDNVGKPFAIVLDNEVISAPVLREPICGGSGQISGGFSVAEANDLALLLRAGALPAPLTIAEERSIGPSLGADSIDAGKIAALVGMGFVILFMVATYGTFGMLSVLALTANVMLVFGVLSALQATLTLPGIAGIVLTIGMAVDANILIFERIREEYLAGRSVLSAIQSGFDNAFSSIVDANITGLIAAIILFSFGTGPIKGFAVTLMIGIATTMFTAIVVTRFLIAVWAKRTGANSLPLADKDQ